MAKKKRSRIDSHGEQAKVIRAAKKDIKPPAHVDFDDDDLVSFDNVIAEFPKVEWTAHTIELAAQMARAMTDIGRAQKQLREEGATIPGARGNTVANPIVNVIRSMSSVIMSLRRSLAMHSRGKDGEARETAERRKAAKVIEKSAQDLEDDDDDDLVNSPHRHDAHDLA